MNQRVLIKFRILTAIVHVKELFHPHRGAFPPSTAPNGAFCVPTTTSTRQIFNCQTSEPSQSRKPFLLLRSSTPTRVGRRKGKKLNWQIDISCGGSQPIFSTTEKESRMPKHSLLALISRRNFFTEHRTRGGLRASRVIFTVSGRKVLHHPLVVRSNRADRRSGGGGKTRSDVIFGARNTRKKNFTIGGGSRHEARTWRR